MVSISKLATLLNKCWATNNAIQATPSDPLFPIVVKNSIPVLWFGDLDAYSKSGKRVVTVGINPSRKEFGILSDKVFIPQPTLRFPLPISIAIPSFDDYCSAMALYYQINPLKTWFWPNEVALNACGSSYGGIMTPYPGANITGNGLHIDIIAPLATEQWGKLNPNQQKALSARFAGLFDDLVEALDPDTLIVPPSVKTYLPGFRGTIISSTSVPIKKGTRSVTKYSGIIGGKNRTVIEGWNGTTPFPFANRQAIFSAI